MLSTLELIQLGFAGFCAFVGACFQFVNNKNTEGASLPQRLVSLASATLLMVLIDALFLLVWHWNFWFTCILGFLLAIGAEIFLRLLMQYYAQSTGLLDFIQRVRLAYKTAKDDSTPTKQE